MIFFSVIRPPWQRRSPKYHQKCISTIGKNTKAHKPPPLSQQPAEARRRRRPISLSLSDWNTSSRPFHPHRGWHVVVLTESTAKGHPLISQLSSSGITRLPKRDPRPHFSGGNPKVGLIRCSLGTLTMVKAEAEFMKFVFNRVD